ncbi:MAG TPA: hypothetical protein VN029_07305, partial [Sphingomonas sp.]|nr:hypothetical protein [Sphingomonas sp.]
MRALFLALALLAGPALAQDKPAQEKPRNDSDIVVVGAKGVPPKAAKRFVRQISSSVDGQLARFAEPVCPIVAGLGP